VSAPEVITLRHSNGAEARILAGFGFNCFSWSVPVGARRIETLWQHPEFAGGKQRPSGSGIPLLFPFPGRIAGGRFEWEGRTYVLPENDNRGNAIHGFVHERPWRVLERTDTLAVGEFHATRDAPEVLGLWPADFRIRARIELSASTLRLDFTCDNPDSRPLPCGFGTHPYYRVPLGGSHADACVVRLPVRSRWELVDLLPTGQRLLLADGAGLRAGRPFGELRFDDAFTDLEFDGDWMAASIVDPESGVRLTARASNGFRECVVYTPPHREAICVEPLTCVPGAILLQPRGLDAGLRVLAPGESFTVAMELALDAFADTRTPRDGL
jgi:aldose 1-epimerase